MAQRRIWFLSRSEASHKMKNFKTEENSERIKLSIETSMEKIKLIVFEKSKFEYRGEWT